MIARRFIFFLLLLAGLAGGWQFSRAQQGTANIEAERARLQAELEAEERAIAEQTKLLQAKQKETATVQGDIDLLKSQILRAQTSIKAKKVAISRLTDDIVARQGKIAVLDDRIKGEQASLAELLRQTRDGDASSLVEIALDNARLSDFFNDLDDFTLVQRSIHQSVAVIRETQETTRQEKAALEDKKSKELDAQKAIELEQQRVQQKESEKKVLLSISKSQEAEYQRVLTERQRKAAAIRAALFALRDTASIPFGDALKYAELASKKTGVRPAFLLAILKQESNLGQNVGSCFLADLTTGNGVGKNTGTLFEQVMKVPRDTVPFVSLTSQLGRDWKSTPVSCPIGSTKYYVGRGFGGAMGPAQFIPSTWMLFVDRLKVALGVNLPDPWNPRDAFMASAMYLSDLGAGLQTYSAEVAAACKYYGSGGAGCAYGSQVMVKAADIQLNMIEPLQDN